MNKKTQVVVGILSRYNLKTNQIEYLFNQRPLGKHYENYWEFAGGKVEANETNIQALYRELEEELGVKIDINTVKYLTSITHDYEHASVELYFYAVNSWEGEPQCLEGQNLMWCSIENYPKPILPSLEYLIPNLRNASDSGLS